MSSYASRTTSDSNIPPTKCKIIEPVIADFNAHPVKPNIADFNVHPVKPKKKVESIGDLDSFTDLPLKTKADTLKSKTTSKSGLSGLDTFEVRIYAVSVWLYCI